MRSRGHIGAATVAVVGLVLCCAPLRAQTAYAGHAGQDPRCPILFEQAVGQLAAEQYAQMLKLAEGRMLLCPEPVSAFVLGLAQANMVDSLAVRDPAERHQMRGRALHNLRVAAAGGAALRPEWQLTVHQWIVHLQRGDGGDLGAAAGMDAELLGETEQLPWRRDQEVLVVPPAPPPRPGPWFPWGPLLTGTAGLGALTWGLVLSATAGDEYKQARRVAAWLADAPPSVDDQTRAKLAGQARRMQDRARDDDAFAGWLLIGGGAAVVAAGIWYWLLPPEGKWRWAVGPGAIEVGGRF